MREDEAREKWCPFARVVGVADDRIWAPANRAAVLAGDGQMLTVNENPETCRCIASDCMAWRWLKPAVQARVESVETGTEVPRVKIKPPPGDGWISTQAGRDRPDKPGDPPWRWVSWEREIPAVPGDGFCGLAGVPQ